MSASKRPVWILEFIVLAAIWGASFLFMKIGARQFGAIPTAGIRITIGGLFLLPFLIQRGQWPIFRQHWKIIFLVGLLNAAIPFACFAYALLSISTGLSAIMNATVPMFGALIAWAWLKDRPPLPRILGLVIGFSGVAMLAWDKISAPAAGQGHAAALAVLACVLAVTCYGLAASVAKKYAAGLPSLVSATGSLLGASAFLLPLTAWYWPAEAPTAQAWWSVSILGILCTGLAYVLYFRLIEKVGPSKALSVTFAIPAFAVFYGVAFLGESVTPWMVLCAAIILVGTSLAVGLLKPTIPTTLLRKRQ